MCLAVAVTYQMAVACTVVRYADDDENVVDGPPPRQIDMLVMVDLDRAAANLTPDYGDILGKLAGGLAVQNVEIRRAALAPMYRRAQGTVPLLYGADDPNGEFQDFADAIAFYTWDDGASYLQDSVVSDSSNLATLGAELDSRSIYHPTTADTSGAAYFSGPADGFLVVYLSASARRCAPGEGDCRVDGLTAVEHLSQSGELGASWLELAGGTGIAVNKIFHAAIVTPEGPDYSQFYAECSAMANFPVAKLDVMQPSENVSYFGPLVEGINDAGGNAEVVNLCEAMSTKGEVTLLSLSLNIRKML
jgi:hypothetical protein